MESFKSCREGMVSGLSTAGVWGAGATSGIHPLPLPRLIYICKAHLKVWWGLFVGFFPVVPTLQKAVSEF